MTDESVDCVVASDGFLDAYERAASVRPASEAGAGRNERARRVERNMVLQGVRCGWWLGVGVEVELESGSRRAGLAAGARVMRWCGR